MAKRKQKTGIDLLLAQAERLPKGPKVSVGKIVTGGELSARFLLPMDENQKRALQEMLARHTQEILDESGKILGIEVRKA